MKVEIRSSNEVYISGYVNAVERESRMLPGKLVGLVNKYFVEKVSAGTFGKALSRAGKVELRFNHKKVIGDNKSNLKLYEDNIGLKAEAVIVDEEVVTKARNGELKGWSFGFRCNQDKWETINENTERRTLSDIEIEEVSILDIIPAYIATSVEMRGEECNTHEVRGYMDECQINDISHKETNQENYVIHSKYAVEILKLKGASYNE